MRRIIKFIGIFFIATPLLANSIKILWDPSPADDLLGYRVYWGTRHSSYTYAVDVGNVIEYILHLNAGEYFIAVTAIDYWGNESQYSREVKVRVGEFTPSSDLIQVDRLYPNPFIDELFIDFNIPKEQHINISIYNSLGQFVKTITDKTLEKANHSYSWDGTNQQNKTVADGTYFCRFTTKDQTITKPVLFTR